MTVIHSLEPGQKLHISNTIYEVVGANKDVRNRKLINGEHILKVVGFRFDPPISPELYKPFSDRMNSTIVVKLPWTLESLKSLNYEN